MINGFVTLCTIILFLCSVGGGIYWFIRYDETYPDEDSYEYGTWGPLTKAKRPNAIPQPEFLRLSLEFAALAVGFFVLFVMAVML